MLSSLFLSVALFTIPPSLLLIIFFSYHPLFITLINPENDPQCAHFTERMVEYAGLKNKIKVILGSISTHELFVRTDKSSCSSADKTSEFMKNTISNSNPSSSSSFSCCTDLNSNSSSSSSPRRYTRHQL